MSDLETVVKKRVNGDLISDLPQRPIEIILSKLPIVEAVRTSILSTRWRLKWTSITDIVFDDKSFAMLGGGNSAKHRIVNFINIFLLLQNGDINKVSLCSSVLPNPYIGFWLLFISRKGVRELTVKLGEHFKAPSSLFSCTNLCRLELVGCDLKLPPNFKGFPFLKYLRVDGGNSSGSDVSNLISSCPLLGILQLRSYNYSDNMELGINSPKLQHLIVECQFKNLYLTNTHDLIDMSITMHISDYPAAHTGHYNFDKFLRAIPKLEKLVGHRSFAQYMSMGADLKCCSLLQCNHLNSVNLKSIDLHVSFAQQEQVRVLVLLVVNSPNLEVLQVDDYSHFYGENDAVIPYKSLPESFMLCKLRTVKLTSIDSLLKVKSFIQLLLKHSPALETMSLTSDEYRYKEAVVDNLIDVLMYTRASPRASIRYR